MVVLLVYNLLLILQVTENMANYEQVWDDLQLLEHLEELDDERDGEAVVERRPRRIVTGKLLVEAIYFSCALAKPLNYIHHHPFHDYAFLRCCNAMCIFH